MVFITLWLQLLGFNDFAASLLMALFALGSALGGLLGGAIGAALALFIRHAHTRKELQVSPLSQQVWQHPLTRLPITILVCTSLSALLSAPEGLLGGLKDANSVLSGVLKGLCCPKPCHSGRLLHPIGYTWSISI